MKLKYLLLLLPVIANADALPDKMLTPGAIDTKITQDNIHKTICVPGYTKTVRPGTHYTNKIKRWQINAYHYTDKDMTHYELDHLIPLSSGGHPSSPANLWPEPWSGNHGARKKDALEVYVHKMVCSGKMPLKEAQELFTTDWISNYRKYIK